MAFEQKLQFVRLSKFASPPQRGSNGAAGYDLASAYQYTIPKRGKMCLMTDLSIRIPTYTYGRIAPRSGLAVKNGLDVGAGVVDSDYRGNIGVVIFNHSDTDFEVKQGDRIAQLILEVIVTPDVAEFYDVKNLGATARMNDGFGSTGVGSAQVVSIPSFLLNPFPSNQIPVPQVPSTQIPQSPSTQIPQAPPTQIPQVPSTQGLAAQILASKTTK